MRAGAGATERVHGDVDVEGHGHGHQHQLDHDDEVPQPRVQQDPRHRRRRPTEEVPRGDDPGGAGAGPEVGVARRDQAAEALDGDSHADDVDEVVEGDVADDAGPRSRPRPRRRRLLRLHPHAAALDHVEGGMRGRARRRLHRHPGVGGGGHGAIGG